MAGVVSSPEVGVLFYAGGMINDRALELYGDQQ